MDTQMKASDLQPGDELRDAYGWLVYTIKEVHHDGDNVIADVKYLDGGNQTRTWPATATVPHVRHP